MSEHASPSVGLEAIDSPKLSSAFSIKELDQRINDGITVRLLWEEKTNTVWVDVQDKKNGGEFIIPVEEGQRPYDVFNHPFAYAAGSLAVAASQEAA
jgi:hypothetical protein